MRKLIVLLALLGLLVGCGSKTARTGEPYDTLTAFGQASGTNVKLCVPWNACGHRILLSFPGGTTKKDVLLRLQEITAAIEAAEEVRDADE